MPMGVQLIELADGVIFRRKWFGPVSIPFAVIAVIWDFIAVMHYMRASSESRAELWMGQILAAAGITYFALALLINRTDIVATPTGLLVRVGPLPWVGKKHIPAQEITDVSVRERTNCNGRIGVTYSVMYAGKSCNEQLLAFYLQSDQAEFVARTVRAVLDIKTEVS